MSGLALTKLSQRALSAEQIVNALKTQLNALKQTHATSACQAEEVKLRQENDQLKGEIQQLKQRLVDAEIKNGLLQIPIPSKGGAAPTTLPVQSVAPPVVLQEAGDQQPTKQKKKEKKNAENKKKPNQPAVPEGPVDFSRLNIKVGHIVSIKRHPDADTLYVEEVDLGEERNRTILSGLVKNVPMEEMDGRLAMFCCNLKPAKMRGIMSEGMIMCASTPEKVEIINPPPGAVKGDRLIVEEYPGTPDAQLNPKKKIWEAVAPDLKINSEGLATYKGALWKIEGKGNCKAPTMTNCQIK